MFRCRPRSLFCTGSGHGHAAAERGLLAAGSHTITATYSGDTNFPAATSSPFIEVIEGPATTTLTITPANAVFSTPIKFAATVMATPPGTVTPTGTVSFLSGTTQLGSASLNTAGIASTTLTGLGPGTYNVVAQYSGDTNFPANSSNTVTLTISLAATSTTLSVSPNPAYAGGQVTISAAVSSPSTPTQPTSGMVTFFDGTTTLTTQPLSPSGTASFTLSTLPIGTHAIYAAFIPPSSGYGESVSPNVNEIILASGFSIALSPTTITLPSGASGSVAIELGSYGNFSGPLALTLGTLPTYATASLQPATVTLTTGGNGASTLTLNTLRKAINQSPARPGSSRSPEVYAALLLIILPFGLLRRGKPSRILALGLLAVALQALTACTNNWYTADTVASGTYQLTVTATDTNQNSHSSTLTVVVTP